MVFSWLALSKGRLARVMCWWTQLTVVWWLALAISQISEVVQWWELCRSGWIAHFEKIIDSTEVLAILAASAPATSFALSASVLAAFGFTLRS